MADQAPKNVKTLIPVDCQKLSSFKNSNNVDTTLYKVEATDEHGGMIDEELRSFQELETGVPQEFRIERYEHPQHGVSYTLYPTQKEESPGKRLGPKVDALREDVDQLREQLEGIVRRIEELVGTDVNVGFMDECRSRFESLDERVSELETRAPLLKRRPEDPE